MIRFISFVLFADGIRRAHCIYNQFIMRIFKTHLKTMRVGGCVGGTNDCYPRHWHLHPTTPEVVPLMEIKCCVAVELMTLWIHEERQPPEVSDMHVLHAFEWKERPTEEKKTERWCRTLQQLQQVLSSSTFSVLPAGPVLMSVSPSCVLGNTGNLLEKSLNVQNAMGWDCPVVLIKGSPNLTNQQLWDFKCDPRIQLCSLFENSASV